MDHVYLFTTGLFDQHMTWHDMAMFCIARLNHERVHGVNLQLEGFLSRFHLQQLISPTDVSAQAYAAGLRVVRLAKGDRVSQELDECTLNSLIEEQYPDLDGDKTARYEASGWATLGCPSHAYS